MSVVFDEAHTFKSPFAQDMFTSFRRALRRIQSFPIWSLFLSTGGMSDQFAPLPRLARIVQRDLVNVTPFCVLGFDRLAKKFHENMTLKEATSLEFRLSLGRPLYALFGPFCSC